MQSDKSHRCTDAYRFVTLIFSDLEFCLSVPLSGTASARRPLARSLCAPITLMQFWSSAEKEKEATPAPAMVVRGPGRAKC